MNKKAIVNTAVVYWCDEDQCYLKESPLFESVLGVGDTPQEAEKTFADLLDDAYEAYLGGRVPGYSKPGRPAKGGVALNSDVRQETKDKLKILGQQFDCSTGEVVDYLLFCWEHFKGMTTAQRGRSSVGQMEQLSDRMTKMEHALERLQKGKAPTVARSAIKVGVLKTAKAAPRGKRRSDKSRRSLAG